MKIFRASLQHIEPITFLFDQYRQFYKMEANLVACRAYIEKRLSKGESVIFGAQNDQRQVVGFTQLYPSFSSLSMRPSIKLNDLFVHPSARRQGVATQLMTAAKRYAQEAGAAQLTLETAFDNHPARELYVSLGYTRDLDFFAYFLDL